MARPLARAYSSFFSSKAGGGRHFVTVKPPKPVFQKDATLSKAIPPSTLPDRVPVHPTLSSNEYKLHHFFSLHRPLLLLNQPTSAIFDPVDTSAPLFSPPQEHNVPWTVDSPPESSPDADADAARQLAHSLVVNRVGGAVAWQQALSRLGLTTKYSEDDLTLAKEAAQEWVTIHADSTRRKRRKKMKKHKLKKRRRLTRHQSK